MLQSEEFDTAEMLMRLANTAERNAFQDPGDASVRITRSTSDETETSDDVTSTTESTDTRWTWGVSAWGTDAW